jgi:hypothetical protein
MGGDLKYGAEHEPAISSADFAGCLWLFSSVCDADHGSAVAYPDIGDHAAAATELNARNRSSIVLVSFPGGFYVALTMDYFAFLPPKTPDDEASLREAGCLNFCANPVY